MSTAARRDPAACLLRFALLATVVAMIAGLLGMHVLAGTHGMHSSSALSTAETQTAAVSHPAAGSTPNASAHPGPGAHHRTPPPSCLCGGDCGGQSAAHVSCIPSPSGASLSAPSPGTTLLTSQSTTAPAADLLPAYSYLPATPTPSELSISRT